MHEFDYTKLKDRSWDSEILGYTSTRGSSRYF